MTAPLSVTHSELGTLHVSAAASMSIARALAPARRSGTKFAIVEPLPTDDCLPYAGFKSPCTTVTCSHGASSSSATIIGSDVLMPCPISEFGAMIDTAPVDEMLTNAFGVKFSAVTGTVSAKAGDAPNRR